MPPPSSTTLRVAASKRSASGQSASEGRANSLLLPDAARTRASAAILTTGTTAAGKRATRITTARHPLGLRDQNATPALRPAKPGPELKAQHLSTAARMPPSYDRASVAGQQRQQPLVARAVNKPPPLTPKIAARSPTLAAPLARRPAPEPSSSANGPLLRDRDELASPVSAFLNSNITPRSGSRQSRVDSANSTPNGTPNPDRHDSWETRPGLAMPGSGPDDAPKGPMVTFSPASDVAGGPSQIQDSKFFYASDAQKQPPPSTSTRLSAVQQQKSPTFFYANGDTVPERQGAIPGSLPPSLPPTSTHDGLMTKFIYANGTPELQPPAKIGPSSPAASASVIPTSPRVPLGRQANGPRAASPVKPSHCASPTIVSPRSPVPATSPRSSTQLSQGKVNTEQPARPIKAHARTRSIVIAEPPAVAKIASAHSSVPTSPSPSPSNPPHPGLSTLASNPAAAGFASLLQAAEDFAEPEDANSESLNSPAKTPQESQLADLVASARRERKAQDLEITNASLEAINRTLERQLRKQTAELRRYQRLSRSGRLSLGSIGSRIPSDSTVDGGALARAGIGLDDLSEEESEIEAEDAELEELEDDADMSASETSGEPDPDATELRAADRRRRDERRLQLDLSKHQQLLIDSQKINQSLKRCLGWTEGLIKEGKRALAYQVRVSDVELGGRVLPPEEVERRQAGEDHAEHDYRDDPLDGLESGPAGEPDGRVGAAPWSKDPQDRDSGIELPTDGG